MAKLRFTYGCMGCSKTANVLMNKFSHEQKGLVAALLKPATDTRDGADIVRSRIGLEAKATVIFADTDLLQWYQSLDRKPDIILVDECNFLTVAHVEALKKISAWVPVECFGLRTDFRSQLFEGSRRLFELADDIAEIKAVCSCGNNAVVNARLDGEGRVITQGEQVLLGGDETYVAMCYQCWTGQSR